MSAKSGRPEDGATQPVDPADSDSVGFDAGNSGSGSPPVVGVGASAGGLEAFSSLLSHLPSNTGLAIVLIQHLEPSHHSDLAEILGRKTSMPVREVEPGMRAQADHVYVIPPNTELRMLGDAFELSPRPPGSAPSLTVDIFLTSLAEQYGGRAIGVILSGTATDGTRGLAAIKAQDGITLVQDPDTARQRGMPASAVAAGVVDKVLPIEEIATELARLAENPYVQAAGAEPAEEESAISPEDERALERIIAAVRGQTGLDLTHYKRPTVLRRIERRMAVKHVTSMSEYAAILDGDVSEIGEMLTDVLVRVTSFFRDPDFFEALKSEAFPSIVASKSGDAAIRVWVPGCATGQEAYSIAIALTEYLEATGQDVRFQVFASDLREDDLAFARRGVYPTAIEDEVGDERLRRFFNEVEGGYQIHKGIRDACVFARHDVTKDPPFGHLDLVSCRNLLIYLDNVLQKKLLGIFHYALEHDGVLVLGESEGVGAAPGLFRRSQHKGIFSRLPGPTPAFALGDFAPTAARPVALTPLSETGQQEREREWADAQKQLDEMLLDQYAPAAVLIDAQFRVKQIRGEAGSYLQFRPGDATLNLASMVSTGFASAIASAVAEVQQTERPARREAVRPVSEGGHATVDIVVIPVAVPDAPIYYAVLFNEGERVSLAGGDAGLHPTETEYLRQELDAATERLRILHFGRDEANESLRAANEEIQSSNEELQSMNEELETAKEELQSTNEELTTLNDELHARNVELANRNDDLNNLLSSAAIAMLVLDADLSVRRYTSEAAALFNLIPGDVGRCITDIRWRIGIKDPEELLRRVVASGQADDREVTDDSGRWFKMTTRPYRTSDGEIRGAVITLMDISILRAAQDDG